MRQYANMQTDLRNHHQQLLTQLKHSLQGNTQRLKVKKKTVSNLFRYGGRENVSAREVDLSEFNKPLYLDAKNKTLDVQGLATWEKIVDFVLPHGFLPLITPELKHITVGGATVGIGIESNTHRYGFVHNSLLEADVLLPDGRIVLTTPTNKYRDLFNALGNSYGTLGYVLRAKIKLRPAKKYVYLTTKKFENIDAFLQESMSSANDTKIEYVEGLAYKEDELYLTTGIQTNTARNIRSIYGDTIFYKEISKEGQITLPTKEYIFRYDPEWFWNIPESAPYKLFRKIAPKSIRNSGFYAKHVTRTVNRPFHTGTKDEVETLIQDWEVPMKHAKGLLQFVLRTVDLDGKPLMVAFVKVPHAATLYPMKKNQLYLNLGSYSFAKKKKGKPPYYYTKVIDAFCFARHGIKMLYSTTFLSSASFNRIYNGTAYKKLKKKYDPKNLQPTLFEKVVRAK